MELGKECTMIEELFEFSVAAEIARNTQGLNLKLLPWGGKTGGR